jgi:four helix bundle protein
MQDFTQLKVWQKAHSFTVNLYKITKDFPSEEKFGLTNQVRRASVSIESNISEGCPKGYRFAYGRNGDKEFSRFLDIAQGSPKGYRFAYACEVKCQILIARDLGYLDTSKSQLLTDKINKVSRMINALNQKLKAKS